MSLNKRCVVMVWNDATVEVCATTVRNMDEDCYAMRKRLHGAHIEDPRWQIVEGADLLVSAGKAR